MLARFVPHIAGGYLRTRQRPNLEIDARALRTTTSGDGGVLLRLGPKLSVDTSIVYRDSRTRRTRPSRTSVWRPRCQPHRAGSDRHGAVQPDAAHDLRAPVHRRARSFPVLAAPRQQQLEDCAGLEFKPFALISGKASVGYRKFDALNSSVPDYSGLAAVDATYMARGTRRASPSFSIADVEDLFELTSPYDVSNGGGVTLTQAIGTSWTSSAG